MCVCVLFLSLLSFVIVVWLFLLFLSFSLFPWFLLVVLVFAPVVVVEVVVGISSFTRHRLVHLLRSSAFHNELAASCLFTLHAGMLGHPKVVYEKGKTDLTRDLFCVARGTVRVVAANVDSALERQLTVWIGSRLRVVGALLVSTIDSQLCSKEYV